MLAKERHQKILALLDQEGSVGVTDLVAQFATSEMTVRRDLSILEKQGLLRRVHGGAVSARGRSYEPPYLMRSADRPDVKQRIGQVAAGLVKNGDSLSLDSGTTTLEVARHLCGKQDLTILTHSFPIANLLSQSPGIRLILTGGIIRPGELSMIGNLAERAYQEYYVDKLFLGIGGIDLKFGLTEFNLEDSLVKRAMIANAREVIIVADASKFDQVVFTSVAPLKVVRKIVTDNSIDPGLVSRLAKEGIEVIRV